MKFKFYKALCTLSTNATLEMTEVENLNKDKVEELVIKSICQRFYYAQLVYF